MASSTATSSAASASESYVFVSVGTTRFDALVDVVFSPAFAEAVKARGWRRVLVQLGRGAAPPPVAAAATSASSAQPPDTWSFTLSGVKYDAYRLKPSIESDIAGASLVISHAGAGSVFETLRARKPLIVAVNTALADNHQVELAEAMAEPVRHLFWCEPATLVDTVAAADLRTLQPLPPPDRSAFVSMVDSLMTGK